MTWIKICGITNLEDALTAVDAGADALGFVFYEKSPRKIDPKTAQRIVAELPGRVDKVGVFVDQTAERVREIVGQAGLTAVQLYKTECALAFSNFREKGQSGEKIIFAVPGERIVDGNVFISPDFQKTVFALLIDSTSAAHPGGTGRRFNWAGARGTIEWLETIRPTIVAGGLTPANVGEALSLLHPWGVDVASGVETRPGKKDPETVRAFVRAVREVEKSL